MFHKFRFPTSDLLKGQLYCVLKYNENKQCTLSVLSSVMHVSRETFKILIKILIHANETKCSLYIRKLIL